MTPLACAVDRLLEAWQRALVVGDIDSAERLANLARCVESEAEYARNVDVGFPIVRRRSGLQYNELLRDPHVRELRQARGLSVPGDERREAAA